MASRLTILNSTRLIASGRFLLAEFMFFYATTDPAHVGFRWEGDDLLTSSYLLVSLALALAVWRSWWWDYVLFPFIFALDILAFLTIPSFLRPLGSSYSVAAVAMLAFILLCSSVRWNWRSTVIFAVALNLASVAIGILSGNQFFGALQGAPPPGPGEEFRRFLLLALVSLVIVWAGMRLTEPKVPKFVQKAPTLQRPLLAEVLDYALTASGASGGAITWAAANDDSPMIARRGSLGTGHWQADTAGLASGETALQPMLFDQPRRRVIRLADDGEFQSMRSAGRGDPFLSAIDAPSGVSVPVMGASGRGRLVLCGVPLMSWDHLRIAMSIAEEIAHALDREQFEIAARGAALARLRHAVARDLHDSVAQSLAGARFWLQAVKARAVNDPGLSGEIDAIQAALESENVHIRNLIIQLRQDEREAGDRLDRSLSTDLADLVSTLALHWRIEIDLAPNPDPLVMSYSLSFDVQQLVREAVANAVRHGEATRITLSCAATSEGLRIIVEDNGKGFPDPGAVKLPLSMSERVTVLGGSLAIASNPGKSRVEIILPGGAPQ